MKRQGKYGFTWDSKAEEWLDWCLSVWKHDPPRTDKSRHGLVVMTADYAYDCLIEARHKPARRDLAPETYQPLPRQSNGPVASRKAPLWPFAAIAVVAAVAAAVLWGWG